MMLLNPIDALYYASTTYRPHTLIDVATLTVWVPDLAQFVT